MLVQASASAGLPAKRLDTLWKFDEYAAMRGRIQGKRLRSMVSRTKMFVGVADADGADDGEDASDCAGT